MRDRAWLLIAAVATLGTGGPGPQDQPGVLSDGLLTAGEERAVLEQVVRYGIANANPTCTNYGSKEAYCLKVGSSERPSAELLGSLADIRPPVLPLATCRSNGIVAGPDTITTDPVIDVEWLRRGPGTSVKARIGVYCYVSEPRVERWGKKWRVQPNGWIGCGPVPFDCRGPVRRRRA